MSARGIGLATRLAAGATSRRTGADRALPRISTMLVRVNRSRCCRCLWGAQRTPAATQGAALFTDDRSALRILRAARVAQSRRGRRMRSKLAALLVPQGGPSVIRHAKATANAGDWRSRGAMMFKSDMFATSCDDYVRALEARVRPTRPSLRWAECGRRSWPIASVPRSIA